MLSPQELQEMISKVLRKRLLNKNQIDKAVNEIYNTLCISNEEAPTKEDVLNILKQKSGEISKAFGFKMANGSTRNLAEALMIIDDFPDSLIPHDAKDSPSPYINDLITYIPYVWRILEGMMTGVREGNMFTFLTMIQNQLISLAPGKRFQSLRSLSAALETKVRDELVRCIVTKLNVDSECQVAQEFVKRQIIEHYGIGVWEKCTDFCKLTDGSHNLEFTYATKIVESLYESYTAFIVQLLFEGNYSYHTRVLRCLGDYSILNDDPEWLDIRSRIAGRYADQSISWILRELVDTPEAFKNTKSLKDRLKLKNSMYKNKIHHCDIGEINEYLNTYSLKIKDGKIISI